MKDNEEAREVETVIDDEQVRDVVTRIAELIKPDKVILFGSRARGTADRNSDIDLVVIYSGPKPSQEVQLAVHRLFAHSDFSLDLFVMRPEELKSQKSLPNTLAREITEHGVVCYG